jgi:hypothetical protein
MLAPIKIRTNVAIKLAGVVQLMHEPMIPAVSFNDEVKAGTPNRHVRHMSRSKTTHLP